MKNGNPFFRPGEELQVSKLRFYSFGVVAANKALDTTIIEVTPMEEFPMIDGELNNNQTVEEAQGVDIDGQSYTTKVTTTNVIKAEWLRFGASNRMTSPNVRRGAGVAIYQFGNSPKYYWNTLKNDSDLRKLETVIWAFSGTTDESAKTDATNSYYFEVSTHTKQIRVHTSQSNGEKYGYDVTINADQGYVSIQDTIGNEFKLESLMEHLYMLNPTGSIIEIQKGIANILTPEQINLKTSQSTWVTDKFTMTCPDVNFME